MKIAYVKNGDAVEQVGRIMPAEGEGTSGGQDAFSSNLFHCYQGDNILVLSGSSRNAEYSNGNVQARVFKLFGKGPIPKIFYPISSSFQLFYNLMRFRPDRMICGSSRSMLWASYLFSKIFSVPMVQSRHNRLVSDKADISTSAALTGNIDRWVMKRADATICHGPFLHDQMLTLGVPKDNLFEFDIKFDTSIYENNTALAPEVPGVSESDRILLFIGRINACKGIFDLLEASKQHFQKHPSLKLVYAGVGPDIDKLRDEIRNASLDETVVVMGRVDHDKLLALIQKGYAVVTPTQGEFPEGRCMAAMEGLVMGIPVVSPDFGPFPYLVKHEENGLLFKTDSVDDLQHNIGRLLEDETLYMQLKQGAQQTARELLEPPRLFGEAVELAFSSVT